MRVSTPLLSLALPCVLAAIHQGLPHEVINVNVTDVAAPEPVSYVTITALLTTTVTSTATDTTTSTVISTETDTTISTATSTLTATTTLTPAPPIPPIPTYTTITPSPSASPIFITAQSQVITTYFVDGVWCVGPALYFSSISGGPFTDGRSNVTAFVEGTGSCSTLFSAVETTGCATTLTGIANRVTVTDCNQEVTFSSENGYTMSTPRPTATTFYEPSRDINGSISEVSIVATMTPAPTLQRLVTYWLAPWQDLTAGSVPSSVDVKICTLAPTQRTCQRYREVWEVVVVTSTLTTSRAIELLTTLSGPGTLVVQTVSSFVTDTVVTIDLSTTLLYETEREVESTSVSLVSSTKTTAQPASTTYVTRHLEAVPSSVSSLAEERGEIESEFLPGFTPTPSPSPSPLPLPSPSPSSTEEPTTTVRITSTRTLTRTGTRTVTRARTGLRGPSSAV
jgi:hypothetical protein